MSGNGEPDPNAQAGDGQGNNDGSGTQDNQQQGNAGDGAQQQQDGNQQQDDQLPGDPSWPVEARLALQRTNREAAGHRVKLREAEGKLAEADKAKLSDIERAQTERDEAKQRADAAEQALRGFQARGAITSHPDAAKFVNPAVVADLIPADKIEYDDQGTPTNIKALVADVGKRYPELLKTPGAFDGGAGQGAGSKPKSNDMNSLIRGASARSGS